jgi:hypothetical protein
MNRKVPKTNNSANTLPLPHRLKIKILVHQEEDGSYWAQVPALPGCVSEGRTREELFNNLRDAIQGILLSTSGAFPPAEGGVEEELEF